MPLLDRKAYIDFIYQEPVLTVCDQSKDRSLAALFVVVSKMMGQGSSLDRINVI